MDNTRPEATDTTEQRIYEAAHDIFLHKGYDGAGFDDIRHNFFSVLAYAVVGNTLAVLTYRKRVG